MGETIVLSATQVSHLSDERSGLGPQVGDFVNVVQPKTCVKSLYSEENL